MTFGERIRARRSALGITQADLALRLHVENVTVLRWEADRNQPGAEQVGELARALECSADWLLGLEG